MGFVRDLRRWERPHPSRCLHLLQNLSEGWLPVLLERLLLLLLLVRLLVRGLLRVQLVGLLGD